MNHLFDIDGLTDRLRAYPGASGLRTEAATLLVEIFHRGEIARGEATVITGLGERTAHTLLGDLLEDGIISSLREKSAVYLSFPVEKRDILFPRLFAGV